MSNHPFFSSGVIFPLDSNNERLHLGSYSNKNVAQDTATRNATDNLTVFGKQDLKTFGPISTTSDVNSDLPIYDQTQQRALSAENVVKNYKFVDLLKDFDESKRKIREQDKKIKGLEKNLKNVSDYVESNKSFISNLKSLPPPTDTHYNYESVQVGKENPRDHSKQAADLVSEPSTNSNNYADIYYPKSKVLSKTKVFILAFDPYTDLKLITMPLSFWDLMDTVDEKKIIIASSVAKMSKMRRFSKFIASPDCSSPSFYPQQAIIDIIDRLDDLTDSNMRFLALLLQLSWLMATGNFDLFDSNCSCYFAMFANQLDCEFTASDLMSICQELADCVVSNLVQHFNWKVYFKNTTISTFDDLAFALHNLTVDKTKLNIFAKFMLYRQKLLATGKLTPEYFLVKRFLQTEIDTTRYVCNWNKKTVRPLNDTMFDIKMLEQQELEEIITLESSTELFRKRLHNCRVLNKLSEEMKVLETMALHLSLFSRIVYLCSCRGNAELFPEYFKTFLPKSYIVDPYYCIPKDFGALDGDVGQRKYRKGAPLLSDKLLSDNLDIMIPSFGDCPPGYFTNYILAHHSSEELQEKILYFDSSLNIHFFEEPVNPKADTFGFLQDALVASSMIASKYYRPKKKSIGKPENRNDLVDQENSSSFVEIDKVLGSENRERNSENHIYDKSKETFAENEKERNNSVADKTETAKGKASLNENDVSLHQDEDSAGLHYIVDCNLNVVGNISSGAPPDDSDDPDQVSLAEYLQPLIDYEYGPGHIVLSAKDYKEEKLRKEASLAVLLEANIENNSVVVPANTSVKVRPSTQIKKPRGNKAKKISGNQKKDNSSSWY